MNIGDLRSKISKSSGKKSSNDVTVVEKETSGDSTKKESFRASAWDLLIQGGDKAKMVLVIFIAAIITISTYHYIAWYSTAAFWLAFPVYYAVFKYVIKVPVVAVIEYDYETKSGDIWGIPRSMWADIDKEGVSAHVSMGGRPVYVAKEFDRENKKIDFAWIHEETFLDFWEDDTAYGLLSEKLQELEERYLRSIALKDVLAHEKAEEHIKLGQELEDELLKNGELPDDIGDIPTERPSKQEIRGYSSDS